MTIAALVLRRPGLIAVTFASVAVVLVGNALPLRTPVTSGAVLNLLVTLSVLGLILDRFGVTLRDSLGREMSQRHDLEEARDDLAVQAENLSKANERLRLEMTERQEAEAARRAIEAKVLEVQKLESLGVLAGGIAHDFNNLLVGILGNASLALLDLPEDSPARQSVVDIERAGQRAGELARQMLAYSGRSRLQIEPVELSELVRDLLTLLQVSIGKGVAIRLDLPDEPVVVDADAAQIRQVVMNLVINAADAIGNRTQNSYEFAGTLDHDIGRIMTRFRTGVIRQTYDNVKLVGGGVENNSDLNYYEPEAVLRTVSRSRRDRLKSMYG